MDIEFRPAEAEESEEITNIIRETSGGLADFSLQGAIPMVPARKILHFQVMDEESPYHYGNVMVAANTSLQGMLLAYDWRKHSLSDMAKRYMKPQRLAVLQDLLQSADENSLYMNTLWIAEQYRGSGLADAFIDLAVLWAQEMELGCLCLHVWEQNARALGLYRRHGFVQTRRFVIPPHKSLHMHGGKLQMVKYL